MNSFSQFSASAFAAQKAASAQKVSASSRHHRQQLEDLWHQPLTTAPANMTPWYQRLGQWLLQAMTDSDQVRIWTKLTSGGVQWHAYDPTQKRHFSTHSEADLRTWLEQRYQ